MAGLWFDTSRRIALASAFDPKHTKTRSNKRMRGSPVKASFNLRGFDADQGNPVLLAALWKQIARNPQERAMAKRVAYFLAALAMASVALAPARASAGWGWWGGPGISITIGPRWGYGYGYRPYGYYGYGAYPYRGYRPYYGYRRYGYYGHRGHWARHAYRRWH